MCQAGVRLSEPARRYHDLPLSREVNTPSLVAANWRTRLKRRTFSTRIGAFVGMLLGGARPIDAAAVQLVVLVELLMVQSLAVVVVVELIARGWLGRSVPKVGR